MLNHSSAKQYEETPHVNKSTKNKRLNLDGSGSGREETAHVIRSTKNKTLNLNGRSARCEETPHSNKSTKNKTCSLNGTSNTVSNALKRRNGTSKTTISNALKRRARSVIKDRSVDAQSRALIRYALETDDPWLPELVRRADAGETIIYTVNCLKHPHPARMIQAKRRLKL